MIKFLRTSLLVSTAIVMSIATTAFAQEESDDIENLFNKEEQQAPALESSTTEAKTPPRTSTTGKAGANSEEIKGVSDLGKLSTFSDVAVIQRRYLPKTGRFELYGAPTLVLNDAFFRNYGLNGRVGYNFSERYGIEFVGFALSTSERDVTRDLRRRGVITTSLITPKSYVGLDFKWTPVYGKMTWRNRTITPFDLYFSFGGGVTSTIQSATEPTLHLGTGQIFALGKSSAFRWDFSWNMFQAASSVSTARGTSLYNTLLLSMGVSFFFPEASYR